MKTTISRGLLTGIVIVGASFAEGRMDPRDASPTTYTALEENAEYQWAPLNWAVRRGDIDRVREFADRGNLEARDFQDRTPLHIAVLSGHDAIVKLLLEKGADPNAQDQWEVTPLRRIELVTEHRGWDRESIADLLRRAGGISKGMGAERQRREAVEAEPEEEERIIK